MLMPWELSLRGDRLTATTDFAAAYRAQIMHVELLSAKRAGDGSPAGR